MNPSEVVEQEASLGSLTNRPWPHLVVNDLLAEDILTQALIEIYSDTYDFDVEYRGTGRIEFSLLKSPTLWRALYSVRMVAALSSAFGVRVKLDKHNMLQLRRMNEETPEFPLHHDFAPGEETIASFLYLSDGWTPDAGGRLHLYGSDKDSAPLVSVEPLQNRLVAFRTSETHWHSVERVHGWERISVLSLWNIETS